jgi:hypothetical protein
MIAILRSLSFGGRCPSAATDEQPTRLRGRALRAAEKGRGGFCRRLARSAGGRVVKHWLMPIRPHSRLRAHAAIASLVALSAHALAHDPWDDRRIHRGGGCGGNFGYCVAGVGDIDLDGTGDFAIGWPGAGVVRADARATPTHVGLVKVHSGANGALLREIHGEAESELFGASIAALGDLDGDGAGDFAVGSFLGSAVRVFSGKSGAVLHRLVGTSKRGNEFLGVSLAALHDLDGDGASELLIGAPRKARTSNGVELGDVAGGGAYLFSGRSGALLRTFGVDVSAEAPQRGIWYGRRVADAGDVDGDGFDDLAIASCGEAAIDLDGRAAWNDLSRSKPFGTPSDVGDALVAADRDLSFKEVGRVALFSGKTGAEIRRLVGDVAGDGFGFSLASLGDLDGDGRAELAVGAFRAPDHGAVYVFDGASGKRSKTLHGTALGFEFGWAVANVGDQNDDGVADFAVGDPRVYDATREVAENRVGEVVVFSGRDFTRIAVLAEGHPDLNVTDFGFSIGSLPAVPPKRSALVIGALNGGWCCGMVFTYRVGPDREHRELHLDSDGVYD